MNFIIIAILFLLIILALMCSFCFGFYIAEKLGREVKPKKVEMNETEKEKLKKFEHEINNFLKFDGEVQKEYGEQ